MQAQECRQTFSFFCLRSSLRLIINHLVCWCCLAFSRILLTLMLCKPSCEQGLQYRTNQCCKQTEQWQIIEKSNRGNNRHVLYHTVKLPILFCLVVPRGEALLSGHASHPDWLQDWPQEGQRVCQEAEGYESGSCHLHASKKRTMQTFTDLCKHVFTDVTGYKSMHANQNPSPHLKATEFLQIHVFSFFLYWSLSSQLYSLILAFF